MDFFRMFQLLLTIDFSHSSVLGHISHCVFVYEKNTMTSYLLSNNSGRESLSSKVGPVRWSHFQESSESVLCSKCSVYRERLRAKNEKQLWYLEDRSMTWNHGNTRHNERYHGSTWKRAATLWSVQKEWCWFLINVLVKILNVELIAEMGMTDCNGCVCRAINYVKITEQEKWRWCAHHLSSFVPIVLKTMESNPKLQVLSACCTTSKRCAKRAISLLALWFDTYNYWEIVNSGNQVLVNSKSRYQN